ncbi:alpha/beta hydrolase [Nonomuraea sp. NPDC050556]|uniref:alpha/beta hydrolase n=1 Tax=Nonomuraea sp. NPDC050556 TaxID=3364369 RepID=UPI003792FA58
MRFTRLSATPFQLDTLPSELPSDADLSAPTAGSGTWVSAPGASLDRGVTVYVHGGGFQFANPDVERVMAYRLSQATGRPVMAVDYRLAPAHRYPAALDDVVAAYRSLTVPASKVILAGESAGGTLVLSALLVLKEAGDPLRGGALVVSPQTDMTLSSPSIEANDGLDVVNRFVLDHVRTQYLDGAAPDRAPQSPLHGDLRGLPPLLLLAGEREVMLDDARRFAEAASDAGVDVELDVYENMTHAFHAAILPGDPPPVAATLMERISRWSDR